MERLIIVITTDPYLGQKLNLELSECGVSVRLCTEFVPDVVRRASVVFLDVQVTDRRPEGSRFVYLCRAGENAPADAKKLPIPFAVGDAAAELRKIPETPRLLFDAKAKTAVVYGQTVHLTDAENALLSVLWDAGGAFVSREELLARVWRGEKQSGILNVYIHYLREKLEIKGEKILLSSRKNGYAIEPNFIERV